ncbi:MAG TPA: hypothetical protein VHD32_17530 [Candidatus Didemnitutus sp.]|nr:hypothetical protein [Candidatus Didemnitutus sp.]
MKFFLAVVLLGLGGCAFPVISLQNSTVSKYAVVKIDWSGWGATKGELAVVSQIDGVAGNTFPHEKGRSSPNGPVVDYLFLEPGVKDLTLLYNQFALRLFRTGGTNWMSASVAGKAELKPGLYKIGYVVNDDAVTMWLEDSAGNAVTEKGTATMVPVPTSSVYDQD